MAFYGVASNLVVYLTTQLREETVPSVRNVNNWTGAVWMTPIVGAYIADTFLGRFWTFTISSLVYLAVSSCSSPGSEFPSLMLFDFPRACFRVFCCCSAEDNPPGSCSALHLLHRTNFPCFLPFLITTLLN